MIKHLRRKIKTKQAAKNAPKTISLKTLHTGQQKILNHPARFKIAACGRRWGKTELGLTIILMQALEYNHRCWWLAPTKKMTDQIWRNLVSSVKDLAGAKISASERRIDLPYGGVIVVHSIWLPNNLRGDGLDFVVLDEAAFIHPEAWNGARFTGSPIAFP